MRKLTYFVMALALVLGFTQCKKEQIEPQGGKVSITLNVEDGASTGSATGKAIDGAKVNVNPNSSPMVTFGNGDRILVAYDGKYVGYLVHNGSNFSGTINASGDNTKPLYFYFLGNCVDVSGLTAGTTTSCTANISDQTGYPNLPVISFSASNEKYNGEGSYTASLHNKCSLMKFNVTTSSTRTICMTGMNNKVTIDFSKVNESGDGLTGDTDQGFSYSVDETDGGLIKIQGSNELERWIIVLPQAALDAGSDGTAYTNEETQRYKGNRPALEAISSNQYLSSGVSLNVNTADNSTNVDLSKLVYNYRANNGETLTGTLAGNYKISIADGATVTLSNATINGTHTVPCFWAGLECIGNATIVLADGTTNTIRGFHNDHPGIYIPNGKLLTIQGSGRLDASSNGFGSGIGGGRYLSDCGNIVIESGIINATGGYHAAGIGSGDNRSCGYISISGGTVTAIGGENAAGIGSGGEASCGNISISGGIVTATGNAAGIGTGNGMDGGEGFIDPELDIFDPGMPAEPSTCGTITISGGTIEATGGYYGAGIGTGFVGNCENISITSQPSKSIHIIDLQ